MSKLSFSANTAYSQYEVLLCELHRLIARGEGNSEAADVIRERMETSEQELSEQELRRLNCLSADLYMLQDDEIFEKAETEERTPEVLGAALNRACEQEEWETVLALLRKGPTFLPRHAIAYLRGIAYEALGHRETALLFLSYAARIDPQYQRLPELLRVA